MSSEQITARAPYPASARLRKRWEFDAVFRTGRRMRGELVRIVFLRGAEGGARFGAVVSKKIAGAVARARGRRIIREAARRLLPFAADGARVVVSLLDGGLEAKAGDVYADLVRLLGRAGVIPRGGVPPWS